MTDTAEAVKEAVQDAIDDGVIAGVSEAAQEILQPTLPDGEYAIVEVLGHRTIVGRIEEVERFGSKLMSIEPIFAGKLLPTAVLIGGSSIYQYTPCTREVAAERGPKHDYQLPSSIRVTIPLEALPAPEDEDEEIPF